MALALGPFLVTIFLFGSMRGSIAGQWPWPCGHFWWLNFALFAEFLGLQKISELAMLGYEGSSCIM
jgi:hypothetical protein